MNEREVYDTKYIFVTGGVMSGLGKGITTASLGLLLSEAGLDVTAVKIDPYINVDAGTMNPFEHGEVFVLSDGSEVDLDLGNYERFLHTEMDSNNNITTGKVYRNVINKEREGEYLGKTVQIIPHVTEEIKNMIKNVGEEKEVCLVEVGGTVGDIEGMPFIESLRQFTQEDNPQDTVHIHVTLIPEAPNGEQKTKPTQHSVKELRSTGIQPDIIIGRNKNKLEKETKEKIALFCGVEQQAVFSNPDVNDIYEVPYVLAEENLDDYVLSHLELPHTSEFPIEWPNPHTTTSNETITIGLAGKYIQEDSYYSVQEAIKHSCINENVNYEIKWIDTEEVTEDCNINTLLGDCDGLIVPGGFGKRGVEGKIRIINYARKNNVPFLGLCLGFQLSVVEYARHKLDLSNAHSTEFNEKTENPVIDYLPGQNNIEKKGGTMRLGNAKIILKDNTLAKRLYGSNEIIERHRHRYEVNPKYVSYFNSDENVQFSGEDNNRKEIIELNNHPYFIASQFHPEFTSKPQKPSPLFRGLIEAIVDN